MEDVWGGAMGGLSVCSPQEQLWISLAMGKFSHSCEERMVGGARGNWLGLIEDVLPWEAGLRRLIHHHLGGRVDKGKMGTNNVPLYF